ncbi:hypothetical protein DPMN_101283 [Dreissena polymorpha]|uniref:Uncharacterized protein n=1 Tax=Dreissena polymorpha TaxID=45954 RepID=A0A9D4R8Z3_DREPO|nr:hypothetical protein DPMN_101283 [Dreissena polymorpha]
MPPPPGDHSFQQTGTIFELIHDIITSKTAMHLRKARSYNENCPAPGGNVFQRTGTIFELSLAIIRTNVLTQFHEDWLIKEKTAPPLGVLTSKTALPPGGLKKVMTKFQEDWTKNETLEKSGPPPGGHVF